MDNSLFAAPAPLMRFRFGNLSCNWFGCGSFHRIRAFRSGMSYPHAAFHGRFRGTSHLRVGNALKQWLRTPPHKS